VLLLWVALSVTHAFGGSLPSEQPTPSEIIQRAECEASATFNEPSEVIALADHLGDQIAKAALAETGPKKTKLRQAATFARLTVSVLTGDWFLQKLKVKNRVAYQVVRGVLLGLMAQSMYQGYLEARQTKIDSLPISEATLGEMRGQIEDISQESDHQKDELMLEIDRKQNAILASASRAKYSSQLEFNKQSRRMENLKLLEWIGLEILSDRDDRLCLDIAGEMIPGYWVCALSQ
jgi:hypothetical protein